MHYPRGLGERQPPRIVFDSLFCLQHQHCQCNLPNITFDLACSFQTMILWVDLYAFTTINIRLFYSCEPFRSLFIQSTDFESVREKESNTGLCRGVSTIGVRVWTSRTKLDYLILTFGFRLIESIILVCRIHGIINPEKYFVQREALACLAILSRCLT